MIFKSSFGAWSIGGKASQEECGRLHASNLSEKPSQSTHTQVVDALFRARSWTELRQTRVRLLEKLPSPSPPTLRHLPAEPSSCPLAIKPFPNNVGSSVTKTAPANIIRPANMAVATLIGELSPSFHQFVSMVSPSALLNLSAFIRRKKKQNN